MLWFDVHQFIDLDSPSYSNREAKPHITDQDESLNLCAHHENHLIDSQAAQRDLSAMNQCGAISREWIVKMLNAML